ncbi:MAG: LysR family transcriptional regulator [Amycolatopsis sp.]|jgi:DNA-binding transcriptional LysR family regulator|uniref:LysR family transcriptional regulator n=1 Tax=Amycolatopsis sp. TaxID=37632 RepID=UPI00262412DF|nr:LysR family transcriptional regulator [Amycolatopsis sp.]MCU1684535.1 LysR family transcriptional regulator [Amycolatopsis sp.]
METRQLEYFVAVAEELSFTRAARRLFAVQSTVSAAVKSLEAELKTSLFDRSTRRVALSAAGSAFLPEAKAALEAFDRARSVVQEASEGLRGSIRFGTMSSVGVLDLPGLLGAFHQRYPLVEIAVSVSPTGSTGLAEDVRHGRLDVALVGASEPELSGLRSRRLGTVPYIAVVPLGHRLADAETVTLADLAGERFVDAPPGFSNRMAIDRAFELLDAPRRVSIEVADLSTVPNYVGEGLGVAVIPDVGGLRHQGAVTVPIAELALVWPFTIVTLADRPPSRALRTLLDLIDERAS